MTYLNLMNTLIGDWIYSPAGVMYAPWKWEPCACSRKLVLGVIAVLVCAEEP